MPRTPSLGEFVGVIENLNLQNFDFDNNNNNPTFKFFQRNFNLDPIFLISWYNFLFFRFQNPQKKKFIFQIFIILFCDFQISNFLFITTKVRCNSIPSIIMEP